MKKKKNTTNILMGINLVNGAYNIYPVDIKQHTVTRPVIKGVRMFLHSLGYDCSLLDDSEVMAFEELMQEEEDMQYLRTVLDFMCLRNPSI